MNDYGLYDLDEDGSYYDDEYDDDEPDHDNYYQTWGWRYRLKQFLYRARWFFIGNFKRCSGCKKRYKDCSCIPF